MMAMRFGQRICSYARINKSSAVPTSLRGGGGGGRSYCSEASALLPDFSHRAFAFAKVALPSAIWFGWFYHTDALHFRSFIEETKAEMVALEMVDRLKREKLKSEDAYLEMLDREANALKEKLSKRDLGVWDTTKYYREIVELRSLIEEGARKRRSLAEADLEVVLRGIEEMKKTRGRVDKKDGVA